MKLGFFTAGLLVAVSACSMALPNAPLLPKTLPPADGRAQEVRIGDRFTYVVTVQALDQALGHVVLRVSRASAPELTYADGLTARKVADAYCLGFNRILDPVAYGKFSAPASWLFEGGCR